MSSRPGRQRDRRRPGKGRGVAGDNADFARLMEAVALELLGQPQERHHGGQEWRYGARGSLSVRIDKGTWFDNEAGAGGGILILIRREHAGMDKDGALAWMRSRKLLEDRPRPTGKPRIVATYDYADAAGQVLFQVVRFDPKDFRQRQPDGKGGWLWKMKGVRPVPFRLPELAEAVGKRTVYIAEGEKGVLALVALGLTALGSPGGAGKWRRNYSAVFAGADVVILPDNDPQATTPEVNAPLAPGRPPGAAKGRTTLPMSPRPCTGSLHGCACSCCRAFLPRATWPTGSRPAAPWRRWKSWWPARERPSCRRRSAPPARRRTTSPTTMAS